MNKLRLDLSVHRPATSDAYIASVHVNDVLPANRTEAIQYDAHYVDLPQVVPATDISRWVVSGLMQAALRWAQGTHLSPQEFVGMLDEIRAQMTQETLLNHRAELTQG